MRIKSICVNQEMTRFQESSESKRSLYIFLVIMYTFLHCQAELSFFIKAIIKGGKCILLLLNNFPQT